MARFQNNLRKYKSFFILDQQGIIYRNTWGFVKSYSYKELDLKIYSVKTTMKEFFISTEMPPSIEIHIILPNKAILIFDPDSYVLKEFVSLKRLIEDVKLRYGKNYGLILKRRIFVLFLVGKTFDHYFKQGKQQN